MQSFLPRRNVRLVTRFILVPCAFFALALPAVLKADPAGNAPSEITPYLDDTTLAIARIDVDRIDWDTASNWEIDLLKQARLEQADYDHMTDEIKKHLPALKKWSADFVGAGGKTVYVVARLNEASPAYAIVPLGAGADAAKLGELLKDPLAMSVMDAPAGAPPEAAHQSPLANMKSEVIGKDLLFGTADTLADFHNFMPATRSELEQAFVSAGNAPVRVAFNPSEGLRGLMVMSVKKLPDELGGGPVTAISAGLRWVSLAMHLPSAMDRFSIKFTVQAKDKSAAEALSAILDKARDSMVKEAADKNADAIRFLFDNLAPKVSPMQPDQLAVTLDEAKTRDAAAKLAGPIHAARESAARVASANNERQIALGIMMYANENKDAYPKEIPADIKTYLGADPAGLQRLLTNPQHPEQKTGYVYVRPAEKLTEVKSPSETPILYEAFDRWADGVNVGYADGHVQFIKDKEQFDKAMKNNPNAGQR